MGRARSPSPGVRRRTPGSPIAPGTGMAGDRGPRGSSPSRSCQPNVGSSAAATASGPGPPGPGRRLRVRHGLRRRRGPPRRAHRRWRLRRSALSVMSTSFLSSSDHVAVICASRSYTRRARDIDRREVLLHPRRDVVRGARLPPGGGPPPLPAMKYRTWRRRRTPGTARASASCPSR